MPSPSIAALTSQVYDLLSPLEAIDRERVLAAIRALCGDAPPLQANQPPSGVAGTTDATDFRPEVGAKARRWISQSGLTIGELEEVFHFEGGQVQLIASEIPGQSRKEQSAKAYLLCGARAFLQADEPTVDNKEAIAYCKHVGCYDKNNHTANRNSLGNKIAGSVGSGFTLPAPGLKAAAALIKEIAQKTVSDG